MRFQKAALIDQYAGKLLLNIVSLIPPFPRPINRDIGFESILVVKFWGLGTIIETTPLIRILRQHYARTKIGLLTFTENEKLAYNLGLFDDVLTVSLKKGIIRFIAEIIKVITKNWRRFTLIIDLEFFSNFSALVVKMLQSLYALGFEGFSSSRNRCYSRTIVFDHSSHVRIIFLKFVNALGIDIPCSIELSKPVINKSVIKTTFDKIPSLAEKGVLHVGVNITTGELSLNRRWSVKNYQKLLEMLQHEIDNVNIYLIGDLTDIPYISYFYKGLNNKKGVYITAGLLDIIETAFVLKCMSFLITNDSGPLHLAEAMGVPVVCFFGPETPNLYGPLQKESIIFYKNLFCSPCLNTYNHKRTKCRDNQCMKVITVAEVYNAIKQKFLDKLDLEAVNYK